LAFLDQDQELVEHGPGSLHFVPCAAQGNLVTARDKSHPRKVLFDLAEVSVSVSK
jgi:hypothetical protein